MKSRKVKTFMARKKPKPDLSLNDSDSDVDSDSFYNDDIDDFINKKDIELSTDDELIQHKEKSSDEEEVLPITDDEKDEFEDDNFDEDDEHDLPNREAWGKKKSAYYSADFVDEDRGRTYREDDAEAAKAEAEEAFVIQKSVYSNINADHLGANLFLEGSGESSGDEEKVDLISATKEEKMKYLRTETQILEVSKEFKSSMQELKKFSKLLHVIKEKIVQSSEVEIYIRAKINILNLYCLNLSQYMMFASSGKNPKYHPVVERISQYKKLLEDMKYNDDIAAPVLDWMLKKGGYVENVDFLPNSKPENKNVELTIPSTNKDVLAITNKEKISKKSKVKHIETENEKEVISLSKEMKKRKLEELGNSNDDEDDVADNENESTADQDGNGDEKRVINYQIAKNKGLVPHRKKEYRNPRVRHRMKFRKAQIRRKGQVRGVYKEIKRYEGEPTGINTNVIKSIKFK